jgi:cell division protein FtsQ
LVPEGVAAQLPLLSGPPGTAREVLERYAELSQLFSVVGERPVQITLSPRLAWQVDLETGMRIELGRDHSKAPMSARLRRFVEVYPELVANRPVRPEVVDLRYPNGFAMKLAMEGKRK